MKLFLLVLLTLSGCAAKTIPTYTWVDQPTALHTMSQRWAAWHSLSGTCLLTLDRADGQSVRLDGAVVLDDRGDLRLRAWKFGQAVFDLTLTRKGLWMATPMDRPQQNVGLKASSAQLARALELFTADPTQGAQVEHVATNTKDFVLHKDAGEGNTLICAVDIPTLTPRLYWMLDRAGKNLFGLTMDRYQQFGAVVWPMRITADAPDGKITVELSDIEINGELAPGAFVPPARAEKQP